MTHLIVEAPAEADLEALWASHRTSDADAAAAIEVLLEEIGYDRAFLARMHRSRVTRLQDPTTDTDRIIAFWRHGYNLLRLKIWDNGTLLPYRVIYAYHSAHDTFHILGVIHRAFCYDVTHPRTQQVLHDYHRLNIPYHGKS